MARRMDSEDINYIKKLMKNVVYEQQNIISQGNEIHSHKKNLLICKNERKLLNMHK